MKQSLRILLAAASIGAAALAQAEVAVIVNAGASAAPSQADVANIFLGKNKSLKGVDQKDWNPTKEKFYAAVTSKNEAQLNPTGPAWCSPARVSRCRAWPVMPRSWPRSPPKPMPSAMWTRPP